MRCKWYKDEFCVNRDCPYVADYCPVYQDDSICKYREDEKKTCYLYGMRLRGFSMGCQPKNGFIRLYDTNIKSCRKYHDLLLYDRPLTDEELKAYELDFIGQVVE